MPMDKPLAGRHALITGGGRGIGLAIAQALHAQGATLTLLGRDAARAQAAALALAGLGIACDVSDEAAVNAAFAQARAVNGPITILVANAGIAESAPLHRSTLAHWNQHLAINLTGAYLCARAAVGDMQAAGWGRIINVASVAGLKGGAYISAYVASKHGMVGLTRALAIELARAGVTVNALCPGYTETDMALHAIETITRKTARSEEQARAELVKANPQGRLVTPQEVGNAAAWLCMPGSEAINGQAIAIAGGEI